VAFEYRLGRGLVHDWLSIQLLQDCLFADSLLMCDAFLIWRDHLRYPGFMLDRRCLFTFHDPVVVPR